MSPMSAIFGIDARVAPPRSGATTEGRGRGRKGENTESVQHRDLKKRRGLRRSGPGPSASASTRSAAGFKARPVHIAIMSDVAAVEASDATNEEEEPTWGAEGDEREDDDDDDEEEAPPQHPFGGMDPHEELSSYNYYCRRSATACATGRPQRRRMKTSATA